MKPKAILVVSTLCFIFWWLCVICFVALPLLLHSGAVGLIARLVIACIAVFLIWLAVKIVQRKRYAWFLGMVVYGIPFLFSLLLFLSLIFAALSPSSVDFSDGGWTPMVGAVCLAILTVCAYAFLYFNKATRLLFRRDAVGVINPIEVDGAEEN